MATVLVGQAYGYSQMDVTSVRTAAAIVSHFRQLDPEIGSVAMSILLTVADAREIGMKDIAQRVGVVKSSVSRTVALMSRTGHKGAAGHDLLTWREDPLDRRNKLVTLTRRGVEFMQQLEGILSARPSPAAYREPPPAYMGNGFGPGLVGAG